MNWADELIPSYKVGRKGLKGMKDGLTDYPRDEQDKTQINSMIGDMSFSIEWMESGRQPGTYSGADRRDAYRYEDMDILPDIYEEMRKEREPLYMSKEQRKALIHLFRSFSERERQCYVMYEAERLSMGKIADILGIKKRTVQQYIERAREKVEKQVS